MKEQVQVDPDHYRFDRYMSQARWNSVWHQINEVQALRPENVLEVGPGAGVFQQAARLYGLKVETLDLDPALNPDHVGGVTRMPLEDNAYDVVCAFQVLEHLPYEDSLRGFAEMNRVARRFVVISLPDAKKVWRFRIHVPRFANRTFMIDKPFFKPRKHKFDGEHYWELNKEGFDLARVSKDLAAVCTLCHTFRVFEFPYHRFFLFEKRSSESS